MPAPYRWCPSTGRFSHRDIRHPAGAVFTPGQSLLGLISSWASVAADGGDDFDNTVKLRQHGVRIG